MSTATIVILAFLFVAFLILGGSMLRRPKPEEISEAEKRRLLGSTLDDIGIDVETENLYSLIGDNTKGNNHGR